MLSPGLGFRVVEADDDGLSVATFVGGDTYTLWSTVGFRGRLFR